MKILWVKYENLKKWIFDIMYKIRAFVCFGKTKLSRVIFIFLNFLIFRKRLMERIEEKSPMNNYSDSSSVSSGTPVTYKPSTLFQHPSSLIAKQITYLDSELFHKIEPAEMLWWAKDQDPKKSPNVVVFTEHFNKISYWVRSNVLKPNDQKEREKYFLKFIKIMKVRVLFLIFCKIIV